MFSLICIYVFNVQDRFIKWRDIQTLLQSNCSSSESDKVFWVSLNVIKYDKHGWVVYVISWTIIQFHGVASTFCCWSNWSFVPLRIFSNKYSGHVHVLLSIHIWFRIGVVGRIAGMNSKVSSISIVCSYSRKNKLYFINNTYPPRDSQVLMMAIGRFNKTKHFACKAGLHMSYS